MVEATTAQQWTVTLTGTGTPRATPGRAGSGTLVRVDDAVLQFDAGRATLLRLAEAGVNAADLSALFLTHHHSDHCISVPDLILGRWIERGSPLRIHAPSGPLDAFGARVMDVWADDIAVRRTVSGRGELDYDWQSFDAADTPIPVWEDCGVSVSAFLVDHAPVAPAVGYRVDAHGRSVVISGDTRICEQVETAARGADVLVHEASLPDHIRTHADPSIIDYHTAAADLGALAARADVGTLVLTHVQPAPDSPELVAAYESAVRGAGFTGAVLVGTDLLTHDLNGGRP